MKTNDELRKENKVLYHIFAEMHDGLDDFEHDWHNWNVLVDQVRVNRILREMVTGALVAAGKCTEYDSKNYINNLIEKHLTKEVQPDKFFSQQNCDRCDGLLADGRTMSRFNTNCLCLKCAEAEKKYPDYQKAVDAEIAAIHNGDLNFKGIGFQKGDKIMTTQTIKVGKTYPVKVGKNNVEVTVIKQTAKGYMVKTAKGKIFPVNNISRFTLPEPKPKPKPAKTPSTKSTASTPSTESKPAKPMTMLTAAVEVLKQTGRPMNVKEIITAMVESNLWQPGKGKTPHLTLSSAFQRALKKPNILQPFRKSTERGKFEYAGE